MKRVRVDEVRPVRKLLHEGELIVTLARVVALARDGELWRSEKWVGGKTDRLQ